MSDHQTTYPMNGGYTRGLLVLLAWSTLVLGCVSTDVGNPGDQDLTNFQLEFAALESSDGQSKPGMEPEKTISTRNGTSEIDGAYLVIAHMDYQHGESCNNPETSRLEGPFVVELVSGAEWPSPVFEEVPRSVCGFEIVLAPFQADELSGPDPESMAGVSVLLSGSRADGEQFVVTADKAVQIVMRANGRMPYVLEQEFSVGLVAFAVEDWLNDGDWDSIDNLPTSALEVTENNRPDLVMRFLANLRSSAVLLHDGNQDGILQPGEIPDVIVSPGAP